MGKLFIFLLVVCFFPLFHGGIATARRRTNGASSEEWGYVEVRPKAHMFWWLYRSPYRVEDSSKPWPIILWLQGGPGTSGVGLGNFLEIGPLDTKLNPRNSTWLHKADLLFVDNPVGTGYSFVEDSSLLVKTEEEAANDLTTLLEKLFNGNEKLQKSPLFIVAESYGGKYAVTLGVSVLKAIESGKLKLKLGGVALGDTWISPEDFVLSWGPLLKDISRLDDNGLKKANSVAGRIQQQIRDGYFLDAASSWSELLQLLTYSTNGMDFYNFLLDSRSFSASSVLKLEMSKKKSIKRYSRYLSILRDLPVEADDLDGLLNGAIRRKLQIIPENVKWVPKSDNVRAALLGDFMKPRIDEVDQLLAKGVNVTVYTGQLDVACSVRGAEAWVKKLKWEGLETFLKKDRNPIYFANERPTKGFFRSYKNLHFYWILGAGHFVPIDQPWLALTMAGHITNSPGVAGKAITMGDARRDI